MKNWRKFIDLNEQQNKYAEIWAFAHPDSREVFDILSGSGLKFIYAHRGYPQHMSPKTKKRWEITKASLKKGFFDNENEKPSSPLIVLAVYKGKGPPSLKNIESWDLYDSTSYLFRKTGQGGERDFLSSGFPIGYHRERGVQPGKPYIDNSVRYPLDRNMNQKSDDIPVTKKIDGDLYASGLSMGQGNFIISPPEQMIPDETDIPHPNDGMRPPALEKGEKMEPLTKVGVVHFLKSYGVGVLMPNPTGKTYTYEKEDGSTEQRPVMDTISTSSGTSLKAMLRGMNAIIIAYTPEYSRIAKKLSPDKLDYDHGSSLTTKPVFQFKDKSVQAFLTKKTWGGAAAGIHDSYEKRGKDNAGTERFVGQISLLNAGHRAYRYPYEMIKYVRKDKDNKGYDYEAVRNFVYFCSIFNVLSHTPTWIHEMAHHRDFLNNWELGKKMKKIPDFEDEHVPEYYATQQTIDVLNKIEPLLLDDISRDNIPGDFKISNWIKDEKSSQIVKSELSKFIKELFDNQKAHSKNYARSEYEKNLNKYIERKIDMPLYSEFLTYIRYPNHFSSYRSLLTALTFGFGEYEEEIFGMSDPSKLQNWPDEDRLESRRNEINFRYRKTKKKILLEETGIFNGLFIISDILQWWVRGFEIMLDQDKKSNIKKNLYDNALNSQELYSDFIFTFKEAYQYFQKNPTYQCYNESGAIKPPPSGCDRKRRNKIFKMEADTQTKLSRIAEKFQNSVAKQEKLVKTLFSSDKMKEVSFFLKFLKTNEGMYWSEGEESEYILHPLKIIDQIREIEADRFIKRFLKKSKSLKESKFSKIKLIIEKKK